MTNEELDAYFHGELMQLRAVFRERWRLHQQKPPSTVYHYTDLAGFTGIVHSGRMWATLSSHLNDTMELLHASALLRDVLRQRARAIHPLLREILIPKVAQNFEFARQDALQVFVSSLTARKDNAHHWELYAQKGSGVAFGLCTSELLKFERQEKKTPYFALGQVIYDGLEQKEYLTWATNYWFKRMSRQFSVLAFKVDDINYLRASMLGNLSVLCGYLALMKKSGWSPEDEWRLGHGHDPKGPDCVVGYRGESRIPYVELDLRGHDGNLPLTEVLVGPSFANEQSLSVIRQFLRASGYEHVQVAPSTVPPTSAGVIQFENGRPTALTS